MTNRHEPIWIVGVGPGDPSYVTQRAATLIRDASAVAGFELPLNTAAQWVRGDRVLLDYRNQTERLEALAERAARGEKCVVCAQGDPNISAAELIERVRAVWPSVEVTPGISSTQIAATRAGLALEESLIITFHKRGDTSADLSDLLAAAGEGRRNLMVLPRPWDFMPAQIAKSLIEAGVAGNRRTLVFERLTLPGEQATSLTLEELASATKEFSDLSIFVLPKANAVP